MWSLPVVGGSRRPLHFSPTDAFVQGARQLQKKKHNGDDALKIKSTATRCKLGKVPRHVILNQRRADSNKQIIAVLTDPSTNKQTLRSAALEKIVELQGRRFLRTDTCAQKIPSADRRVPAAPTNATPQVPKSKKMTKLHLLRIIQK